MTVPASAMAQPHAGSVTDAGPGIERSAGDDDGTAQAKDLIINGDLVGALDVLNEMGAPRVGELRVDGLEVTREHVARKYLGLQPGALLTRERFSRARRRLAELPVASRTILLYDIPDGSASVRAIVVERERYLSSPSDWVRIGGSAAFGREVRPTFVNVARFGDSWEPFYRWEPNRPRIGVRVRAPAPGWLPGLAGVDALWERQTYLSPSLQGETIDHARVRVGARLSDWLTSWLRWEGGAAADRFDSSTYLGLDGRLSTYLLHDTLSLMLAAGQWIPFRERVPFSNAELMVKWRSTSKSGKPAVTLTSGAALASRAAPPMIWSGAGLWNGRSALRAHPLHDDGIVTGEVFGRRLAFLSAEYEHPVRTEFGTVGLAGFADASRAWSRLDWTDASRLHTDIGAGVRFSTSGSDKKVRVDVAYGLRDGRTRVSAGYLIPWGIND